MTMQADSVVGFKHRLANYFERISGDASHLKSVMDVLPKSYTTPEAQDTLMRFISDRCGVEEAEAVEELDYVTARLERERRNERFERLLEPWSIEQLEASLRRYFSEYDQSQLPTVSALVTFYRGREITLIRELELQYRRPLLLHRDDDDVQGQDENGALGEIANSLAGGNNPLVPEDGNNDDDDSDDGNNNASAASGGFEKKKKKKRGDDDFAKKAAALRGEDTDEDEIGGVAKSTHGRPKSLNGKSGKKRGGGEASSSNASASGANSDIIRNPTSYDELTVDSMHHFEKEILRFLLDIRQELHDRIRESELIAQQIAATTATTENVLSSPAEDQNGNSEGSGTPASSASSPVKRKVLRKSSMLRRRLMIASQLHSPTNTAGDRENPQQVEDLNVGLTNLSITANSLDIATNSQQQTPTNQLQQQQPPPPPPPPSEEEIAKSVTDLTKELSALPRKRLARVEKMMQIIPLVARAVTPIYKSQLFLYLGFYCSLRIEARKVMQKRIAGALHDAPMKADENFQRRSAVIFASEKDSRTEISNQERRMWAKVDPMFYRERFLRLQRMLMDEEQSKREEIEFDELCISSVARAKLRSLLFIERSYVELNSFM